MSYGNSGQDIFSLWDIRGDFIFTRLWNPVAYYVYNISKEKFPADAAIALSYFLVKYLKRLDPQAKQDAERQINKALKNDINQSRRFNYANYYYW